MMIKKPTQFALLLAFVMFTGSAKAQDTDAFSKVRQFLADSVANESVAGGVVLVYHVVSGPIVAELSRPGRR